MSTYEAANTDDLNLEKLRQVVSSWELPADQNECKLLCINSPTDTITLRETAGAVAACPRYLRARKGSVDKASAMLQKSVQWRAETGVGDFTADAGMKVVGATGKM